MIEDLSSQLSQCVENKRLKKKFEHDLQATKTELQDESNKLAGLKAQLDKEKVDVEKLEGTSLTSLFYSVLGSRAEQLEKERQELLAAQLSYQQTKRQVAFLEQEYSSLLQKLEKVQHADRDYEQALSEKERYLKQSDETMASELLALSEQMATLSSELKEIKEAITAGNSAIVVLEQVIDSLGSAENWGAMDMLGGGIISTAIKHGKIDDARYGIEQVQKKISRFKRELADVQQSIDIHLNIDELSTFADYFFDGLIIDWVIQNKIADSLEKSREAKMTVSQVVNELKHQEKMGIDKFRQVQEKRARLIERA
jgi:chromosome segregation ATPase